MARKECILQEGKSMALYPYQIDKYVTDSLEVDEIVDVIPGYDNTAIICSTKSKL